MQELPCANTGEGGFGPDLAGRKLTQAQFLHAVQKPWGIMPSFPQFNEKQIADLYAYVSSLPGVPEPAACALPAAGQRAAGAGARAGDRRLRDVPHADSRHAAPRHR